jgi:hypothetical protein
MAADWAGPSAATADLDPAWQNAAAHSSAHPSKTRRFARPATDFRASERLF